MPYTQNHLCKLTAFLPMFIFNPNTPKFLNIGVSVPALVLFSLFVTIFSFIEHYQGF